MEKIFLTFQQMKRIMINKGRLEKELGINIISGRNFIQIEGSPIDEYSAMQVLQAVSFNFDVNISLLLKDPEYMLRTIQIKDYIKKSPRRISQVKARVIGERGGVLKNISQLSGCAIKLHDSTVEILGKANDVETAISALISLIRGSKHSNIYARLERASHEEESDLGLKSK